jgi:hypothetical protein
MGQSNQIINVVEIGTVVDIGRACLSAHVPKHPNPDYVEAGSRITVQRVSQGKYVITPNHDYDITILRRIGLKIDSSDAIHYLYDLELREIYITHFISIMDWMLCNPQQAYLPNAYGHINIFGDILYRLDNEAHHDALRLIDQRLDTID